MRVLNFTAPKQLPDRYLLRQQDNSIAEEFKPVTDSLRFGSQGNLLDKYGINPNEVIEDFPEGYTLSDDEKRFLLNQALKGYEHSLKNRKAIGKNQTLCYVTSHALLNNGKWYIGGNIETARDTVLCGERAAMTTAWNNYLSNYDLDKLPAAKEDGGDGFKVNKLVMTLVMKDSDELQGPVVPCSECQKWMISDQHFSPDTELITLHKDKERNNYIFRIRQVKDIIPHFDKLNIQKTEQSLNTIPLDISESAQTTIDRLKLSENKLRKLVKHTKRSFDQYKTATFSEKDWAAGALSSPFGIITTGSRHDWSKRWPTYPDKPTAARALQYTKRIQNILRWPLKTAKKLLPKFLHKPINWLENKLGKFLREPALDAIAYYGEETQLPIDSLGRFAQTGHQLDTLLLYIKNDRLQVNVLKDILRETYYSPNTGVRH